MSIEKRILEEILRRMDDLKNSFIEHPVENYESYRERVGQLKGLKEAFDIVNEAVNEDNF